MNTFIDWKKPFLKGEDQRHDGEERVITFYRGNNKGNLRNKNCKVFCYAVYVYDFPNHPITQSPNHPLIPNRSIIRRSVPLSIFNSRAVAIRFQLLRIRACSMARFWMTARDCPASSLNCLSSYFVRKCSGKCATRMALLWHKMNTYSMMFSNSRILPGKSCRIRMASTSSETLVIFFSIKLSLKFQSKQKIAWL